MIMNRRSFLKALGVTAMAGVSVPATATTVPNKYEYIIAMYDACVELKADQEACGKAWASMMQYAMENFPTPAINRENLVMVKDVIDGKYSADGVRTIPPHIIEELYPLLVARTTLYVDRLPIEIHAWDNFGEFRVRYGALMVHRHATDVKYVEERHNKILIEENETKLSKNV